ncbi:hypothetical protein [Olivibacter sitiensis]|uniref:hypothetical protein n=1 Tax=Olivibacter sitiensis TaxID=376470 RepID=UPI0003F93BF8|nr:hypothetical protein [Olivibacter sitiensis]
MNKCLLSLFLILPYLALAQPPAKKVSWDVLENIQFDKKFVKEYDSYAMFPKFTPAVKNLEGQIVEIEGFTIPLELSTKWVALSVNPNSSCFFCGAAGPASVMTVRFKNGKKQYEVDDYKRFRGKLKLNSKDINEFYYILEDAVEVR